MSQAAPLGKAAILIGLECWYRAGLLQDFVFRLNLARLKAAPDLDRRSATRGLQRLETAGLVSVARPAGQRTLVCLKVPNGCQSRR